LHLLIIFFGLPLLLFMAGAAGLFVRQANARRRAQALLRELEASNRQLADYASRVQELTLSAERQRMARELHDTLAQGLAGLIMQLEAIDSHLERGSPERAHAVTEQAMTRARTTLAEARSAIQSLRDNGGDNTTVLDAVRREVDQFTQVTGVPCLLEIREGIGEIPGYTAEHALRIVQESLANVARHARAAHAWVRWNCRGDLLELTIQDDGVGFDPSIGFKSDDHFGLLGLNERVQLARGTLTVESASGHGTRLTARLPLGAAEGALA
jgi:two-component system, NarL family, sensor histidine kinase YdfH